MKAIQKGSEDESAKANRKPQPKQQKKKRRRGTRPQAACGIATARAMREPRRHVRREVGIGMRLPAYYDEVAGEVAEQNVVLDLRVLCGTSRAEAHVPVRGSVERVLCGLNVKLPDAHVTAVVFSGATEDMLEILLRTGAKTAAGGERNRDEKGIALIMLNNCRDPGAAAPLALTCAEDA